MLAIVVLGTGFSMVKTLPTYRLLKDPVRVSVVTHTYTLFSNYVEYISPEQSFQSTPRQLLAPAAQPFTLVGSDSIIRFGCLISSHISILAKIRAFIFRVV